MSIQDDIQKSIANNELYAIGETLPTDWKEAFNTYLALAKQNNAKAQFNLGYMYARGDIMERDPGKAYEWYQKAADNNDPRAHYNLSKMYEVGEFVLQNAMKAQEHLKCAIELGDDRAKIRTALANAKEALKQGDREKAKSLFASISASSKEAEMGVIACNAVLKCIYNTNIVYSYHSSGSDKNKKFWKWAESVKTEVDLTMTNHSTQSWQVMVKALIRAGDGFVNISTIGGVLKSGETLSNIIDPEDFGGSKICGVAVYSDREGSVEKPVYSFYFPDTPIQPDEKETRNLPHKVLMAQNEMNQHNKTVKPGACFVLTACYGSYDAPTVLTFRQFRDNYLAQYKLGRRFIVWYYTHGPSWADAIEHKPGIKAIFRSLFKQLAKVLPK
jgi:ribosomal protein S20